MRLTEKEMTAALTGVAKQVVAAQDRSARQAIRTGEVTPDELWEAMTRYQRYVVLNGLGDQVLPVLVALPDVEVAIGERPVVTDAEIAEAVEAQLGDESRLRRKAILATRVALVRMALDSIPPKADPDAFVVPDFL